MAYEGYLIKVGSSSSNFDYTIPFTFIKADTLSTVWSTTDIDSFRDADVALHRTVSPNKTMKVEFETPDISNTEFDAVMSEIRSRFVDSIAKSIYVKVWIPELGAYKTDKCYMPDVNVQIRFANSSGLRYDPVRIAFIGYTTSAAT